MPDQVHDAGSRSAELLLVRDAQAGDVVALGVLFERYRPAMHAVALGVLGRPSDAEDAVQDAMLAALGRIGDLRDPGAIGPWLKMIVRNCCRMHVRANLPGPVAEPLPVSRPAEAAADPAVLLEDHAARDWVWDAVEQLSEPLRVVTLLRYFTRVATYEQIAAICGIPVGTVRSRLSKARSTLAGRLRESAAEAHGDAQAITAARRREAEQILLPGPREYAALLRGTWHPRLRTVWPDGRQTLGVEPVIGLLDRSTSAGVVQRLPTVVASRQIVIWETEILNPPEDPYHCPAGSAWLMWHDAGRVSRLRLFHEPHAQPHAA
jgi:RNA polymerase sigma factor (sigma-70 family)